MKSIAIWALLAAAFLTGCAPYKYHAAPISAAALAHSLYSRNLDDPDLRSWMKQNADLQMAAWPLKTWDLESLTLAAYYFNPVLDVARANVTSSEAAIQTAAMKPNPAVAVGPGYETVPGAPFIMGIDFSLPIETAGKRGYRIANATHLSRASRLQLAQTAWGVRSRVRSTLVDYLFAVKAAGLLQEQESLQSSYAQMIEARFRAGEITLPEVTTARIDLTRLREATRTAEGKVNTTHAALAAAIGIPDSALDGKTLTWLELDHPPAVASLPPQRLREAAVLNRLDVQRALEQYEAAQSNLQLQAARQYPDINLGPGYAYEEGYHLFSLRLSSVLPLRNHNEGPIAEAEAQRKVAGAQLLAVQSTVIADSDKALAQYNAAYATLQESEHSVSELKQQQRTAACLLQSGETEQITVTAAEVQTAVAEGAQLGAVQQAQLSLGLVEDAIQRPIGPGTTPEFPRTTPRSIRSHR